VNVKYQYRGTLRTMGNRDDGTGDWTCAAEIVVGGVKAEQAEIGDVYFKPAEISDCRRS
jgi:hypothetical protein